MTITKEKFEEVAVSIMRFGTLTIFVVFELYIVIMFVTILVKMFHNL